MDPKRQKQDTPTAALEKGPKIEEIIASGLWERVLLELRGKELRIVSGIDENTAYEVELDMDDATTHIQRVAFRAQNILASGAVKSIKWIIAPNFAPPDGVRATLVEALKDPMVTSLNSRGYLSLNIGNEIGHDILRAVNRVILNTNSTRPINLVFRKNEVTMNDFPIRVLQWFSQQGSLANALRITPRFQGFTLAVGRYLAQFTPQIVGGSIALVAVP